MPLSSVTEDVRYNHDNKGDRRAFSDNNDIKYNNLNYDNKWLHL